MRLLFVFCMLMTLTCKLVLCQEAAVDGPSASSEEKPGPEDVMKELLLLATNVEKDDSAGRADAANTFSAASSIRTALSNQEWQNASQMVESNLRNIQSDKFRDKWRSLSDSIRKAVASEIESALPAAKKILLSLPTVLAENQTSTELEKVVAGIKKSQIRIQKLQALLGQQEEVREQIELLNNAYQYAKRYQQMLLAIESNDFREAGRLIQDLTQTSQFDVRLRQAITPFTNSVIAKRHKDIDERLTTLYREVKVASSSEEIANLAKELQLLDLRRREIFSSSSSFGSDISIGNQVLYLGVWKEVLDLESMKRYRTAIVKLGALNSTYTNNPTISSMNPIISREMLQAKLDALSEALEGRADIIFDPTIVRLAELLGSVTDIPSLRAAMIKINSQSLNTRAQEFLEDRNTTEEIALAQSESTAMLSMDDCIGQRNWDRFWTLVSSRSIHQERPTHRWNRQFEAIRTSLIRRALMDSKEYKDLKLPGNDPIDIELLSGIDEAITAKDYRKGFLALQLYRRVVYPINPPDWLTNELVAFQFLAQAESFDLSGDTLEAGRRYRSVATYPSARIPIDFVQERLKVILSKHPELIYEKMQTAGSLQPPPSKVQP
jgi:hypothetical protein